MAKRIDFNEYIGNRYGRLTVIKFVGRFKNRYPFIECKCDCGKIKSFNAYNVIRGLSSSCGCLRLEAITKHGASKHSKVTRIYRIWGSMKIRCYNIRCENYNDYGGRGITMCDEWRNDFEAFRDWALQNGYSDKLSIDRIDVNGDYEPSNCKWSTNKEQSRNRRSNKIINYNGVEAPLIVWTERLGLDYITTKQRLYSGWDVERAFNEPVNRYKKRA